MIPLEVSSADITPPVFAHAAEMHAAASTKMVPPPPKWLRCLHQMSSAPAAMAAAAATTAPERVHPLQLIGSNATVAATDDCAEFFFIVWFLSVGMTLCQVPAESADHCCGRYLAIILSVSAMAAANAVAVISHERANSRASRRYQPQFRTNGEVRHCLLLQRLGA